MSLLAGRSNWTIFDKFQTAKAALLDTEKHDVRQEAEIHRLLAHRAAERKQVLECCTAMADFQVLV